MEEVQLERYNYMFYVQKSTQQFVTQEEGRSWNDTHYTMDFAGAKTVPSRGCCGLKRKVQMFGFLVDGLKQYIFLIDVNETIGRNLKIFFLILIPPQRSFGGILESPCLSVCTSVDTWLGEMVQSRNYKVNVKVTMHL